MRESIFSSSIRAFFVTLFAVIGFCIGLFLLLAIIGVISDTATEPELTFTQQVIANADGVRKAFATDTPVILQLNINGIIGTDKLTMENFRQQLIESQEGHLKDKLVKGILLQINSPGGTVTDSSNMYQALKAYKEKYKIPVYAYIDGICASGALYIACASDKIFANETSMIGSVGVISPSFVNVYQLMEKIGVQSLTVYAGKEKDQLNPLRPWVPGEQDSIQDLINYYYKQFVNVVATNRPKMDKAKLVDDYGAKVFNPEESQQYGYIDATGYSRSEVLKHLLNEIGIKDDKYQVVELEKKSWLSELYSSSSNLLQGKIVHQIQYPSCLDPKLTNQFLYLYRPE